MTSPTPRFDASEFGLSPEDFVSEAAVCDVLEAAGGVVTGRADTAHRSDQAVPLQRPLGGATID